MSAFKKLALTLLAGLFLLIILAGCSGSSYTAQVEDYSQVLDTRNPQLQKALSDLPWQVYIETKNYGGSSADLYAKAQGMVIHGSDQMMVILIDPINRHIAIRDSEKSGILTNSQYQDAIQAFGKAIGPNNNYTQGLIALMHSMVAADQDNGTAFLWILALAIVFIIVCGLIGAWMNSGSGSSRGGGSSRSYSSSSVTIFSSSSSDSGSGGGGFGSF